MANSAAHLQVRRIRLGRGRVLILGGALAAVVVLGVFAALGQHWLSTSVYGPQATAQQFADAEASGDATAALRTLSTPPHAATVSDAALKYELARHPISDVKVTVSNVVDRFALATVSYRQDGKAVQVTLNLTQQENSARFLGLFPKWAITSGALGQLSVGGTDQANGG